MPLHGRGMIFSSLTCVLGTGIHVLIVEQCIHSGLHLPSNARSLLYPFQDRCIRTVPVFDVYPFAQPNRWNLSLSAAGYKVSVKFSSLDM
ncbi:hypothetical protein C8R42DRAFT_616698 [Lentinula raphanica]|nr:hypothetical protein C8R42DRAFT_616698 [Lentinula raphanica]